MASIGAELAAEVRVASTGFFFSKRRLAAVSVFPPLLALCIRSPYYTFGSPPGDYYSSSPFLAMPLWFLKFAILSPKEGADAPAFVGNTSGGASCSATKRQA